MEEKLEVKKIKLFTRTVCPKCILVKQMMTMAEVEFETVNIDHDEKAKQEVLNQGFLTTPVVFYDGKYYGDNSSIQQLISEVASS